MFSLLIDTCTEQSIAAVAQDDLVLQQTSLPTGYGNSKLLLPALVGLIKSAEIELNRLAFIAIASGPGSYTSIRIGASIAKTLSYALKIPLISICSLENFIPSQNGLFAAMIDAKIGGAYAILGSRQDDTIVFHTAPALYPLKDLGPLLQDVSMIVTPKSEPLRKKIEEMYPLVKVNWEEQAPHSTYLLKAALKKFRQNEFSEDGSLDILYLRKTQAEIEQQQKELS